MTGSPVNAAEATPHAAELEGINRVSLRRA